MPVTVRLPKEEEVPANKLEPAKNDRLINSVTFFGDSAIPEDDDIYKSVFDAAKLLAQNGYSIVDGGGPGIMKAATDGAESVNGRTIAVYWQPKLANLFEGKNLANVTDESETFSNYLIRTLGLIEHGDAYVVCKGGTGTISEWGMVWALSKLYYGCNKPVILYGDFWDKLVEAVQKYMNIDDLELGVLYNAYKPEDILPILALHEKKIAHCRTRKFTGDEGAFVLGSELTMVQKAYDTNAAEWHAMHAGNPVAQEQLDEFMSLVNPPAKVLDVGAGPGTDASYLSTKYAVTGIELSQKFTDIAKYENPNVELVNADIITYDVGVGKYKGIWARNSLHHIPEKDQDPVFKKLADGLVQGGILYIIAREGDGEFVEEDVKNYLKVEKFYHTYSDMELKQRGERAGLKLIRVDHQHRSHKWIIGIFRKE